MDYNGGALIGMKGKNCVAIATDKRFGIQAQTVSLDFTVCIIMFIINLLLSKFNIQLFCRKFFK